MYLSIWIDSSPSCSYFSLITPMYPRQATYVSDTPMSLSRVSISSMINVERKFVATSICYIKDNTNGNRPMTSHLHHFGIVLGHSLIFGGTKECVKVMYMLWNITKS
jgi:hypothetical protein